MKIGIFDSAASATGTLDDLIHSANAARSDGFHSWWIPQIFGYEALTVLAVVGQQVSDIELGTAVVPTFPRHPVTMAASALTTQAATHGRLSLGIGLSHEVVIENMFGLSFAKPIQHMSQYLDALIPLLHGQQAATSGETIRVNMTMSVPSGFEAPPLLLAALGPKMLQLAAQRCEGTVTWMCGQSTLSDYIVPTITSLASQADRPAPRIVACLPTCVTDNVDETRERCATLFAMYGFLPSYRAMLDKEGVDGPADVALIGSHDHIVDTVSRLAERGVTDFVAVEFTSNPDEATATRATLASLIGH